MANIRTNTHSFNGGEVTPEFYGQVTDAKFNTGLALCRNFIAKPQGPVENRAGFAFVRAVKDSTKKARLIPFTYSTTQTMAVEMGAGYFRFHTLGATLLSAGVPYEVANPYAEADLFDIHYVQSADVLTLVHPNYAPRELRRLGATSWTLTTIAFTPAIAAPANLRVSSNGKGIDYTYRYLVTAVAADGVTESAASAESLGYSNYGLVAATNANPGVISFAGDLRTKLAVGATVTFNGVGGMVQLNGNTYTIGSVTFTPNVPTWPSGADNSKTTITLMSGATPVNTTAFGAFTTGGSMAVTYSGAQNNLFVTGGQNNIGWDAVTGASRYNIYKFQGGLFGYIGQTTDTAFVDDNISPDLSKTPPTYDTIFQSASNYPGAVSYFEQRRCFSGTLNQPQNIWMTRSGTESAMSYSLPIRDDDRIAFRVAAREANTIRHIVPLNSLVLLTSAAEWRVTSINSDAITPTTISVRPQSYVGASNMQPVIINNNLLYGAARGGHMREMAYSWQANGFATGDLSLRAPHLFDGYEMTDMAYSKAPIPIVWAVSNSGKLLGLTYVPEQQVGSWHWHDTDGVFESCTVVAEGGEDVLYVVVLRTINGASVRYVERMASRRFATQADAFFVDAGATYSGAPATSITGLTHLEGKTVSILADGAVHPQRVVTGGTITLDQAASKVQVGLPITADAQTLPLAAQIDGGLGQGRQKNVNKVWLRVFKSSGIFVGPSVDQLVEAKQRTTEPYGSPPALKSSEIEIVVKPDWGDSAQIFVRQSDPLPLTLVSMTMEVAIGG